MTGYLAISKYHTQDKVVLVTHEYETHSLVAYIVRNYGDSKDSVVTSLESNDKITFLTRSGERVPAKVRGIFKKRIVEVKRK